MTEVRITRADIQAAATRIAPFVRRTPVIADTAIDAWVGARVFVKCEHRQHVGAFKYRGATNAVQSLTDDEARRGVCAHSSGNHAAALALAAATRGIPAYVVMPEGAPDVKRLAVERNGGQINWCANTLAARVETLRGVMARTGAVEIHPFDDPRVIAGAGTAALELLDDVPDLDVVVTPIGGGGLCSGTCIAVAPTRVIAGVPWDRAASLADGLRTGASERTAAILRAHEVTEVVVSDAEMLEAMKVVRDASGEVIEPSAAVAFVAARKAHLDGAGVGIISSGGNVDPTD